MMMQGGSSLVGVGGDGALEEILIDNFGVGVGVGRVRG
jgi:hypothetical protein